LELKTTKDTIIRLSGVEKYFDDTHVVKDMNLEVQRGEFLTLLGPSGCGKTTTLRMIAGFEQVSAGKIELDGVDVQDLKPNERNVNTVFQNYALFPHMNVEDNIAFGLVEKKVPKKERKERVEKMLRLVQLEGFEKRMPNQMSGGQKQRVAIARALVNEPQVLLLDEPLGALDLKLRKQMQFELKHLQQQLGITFIYVTHDQEEALTMSDRIAVMNNGVIEQIDTPQEVYDRPKTKYVADFIGESNIIEGYAADVKDGVVEVSLECGKAKIHDNSLKEEEMFYFCVRPENLKLSLEPVAGFRISALVKEHIFVGSLIRTVVKLVNGQELIATSQPDVQRAPVGSYVWVYWDPAKAVIVHTVEEQIYNIIENNMFRMMDEMCEGGFDAEIL
jgi:spermidine/putrescine transport system ATP-binding protein